MSRCVSCGRELGDESVRCPRCGVAPSTSVVLPSAPAAQDASVFRVAACTDVGPRKDTNQDACCAEIAQTSQGDTALLAVCDGVGGLSAGELASASLVAWLSSWFETRYPWLLAERADSPARLFDGVRRDWERGLSEMNDALVAQGNAAGASLGSTFTAILLFQGVYLIGHVGDTRVYRFSDRGMGVLTDDQTWVAREVALGHIPAEQARSHPRRSVLLQSVGTQSGVQPVFYRGACATGDVFVTCCDGFRNELFDDELTDAFCGLGHADERALGGACAGLLELVRQRGETDNVTAVAMGYRGASGDAASAGVEQRSMPTGSLDDLSPATGASGAGD